MNRDIIQQSNEMVQGFKEIIKLREWVEKNETDTNHFAMLPIKNFLKQVTNEGMDRKKNQRNEI